MSGKPPMNDDKEMAYTENTSSGSESSGDENLDRGNWSRKMDFMLSCLSYAVGLGNVWRFPYVCYRNGAGAFMIPFFVMLFITGIPLVFLELSFGQFASSGVVSLWKASPLFQGVGWAMFIVSVFICIYYNMIIAYTLYYLFASFASVLPWSECGDWSTEACQEQSRFLLKNCSDYNGTWCNDHCYDMPSLDPTFRAALAPNCTNITKGLDIRSPSDEYFHVSVLGITDGVHEMGTIRWGLVGCLALAWVLVAICLAKGIKTSGKAVYFTAFFPYVVLLILLIRGLTLEGSVNGIIYYITPQWDKILKARVWGDAAVQIFFSLSPCWGGLITLASYNKFHNNTFYDAIIVSVLDCLTSVFAGLVIFSIIGYMAAELDQPIDKVASEGAGLAFIVYPEVVTKLPISQLWSVLFFAMLITLGLGTQIATVTTVHTTLLDQFPHLFRRGNNKTYLLIAVSIGCFLIGLPFCTQGGMYVLQLFDNYAATYSLLMIGFVECIGVAWVYGSERFLQDIHVMIGSRPHKIWVYSWKYIAPVALLAILIFTWVDFKPTKYDKYEFPGWAEGCGFLIAFSSVILIPITACWKIVQAKRNDPVCKNKSIFEVMKHLTHATEDWGPALKEHRALRQEFNGVEQFESQIPLTNKRDAEMNDTKC